MKSLEKSEELRKEKIREYYRIRYKTDEAYREGFKARSKKFNKEHFLINRSHWKVWEALRYGRLKKLPCQICGSKKVQGHHKDYNRPLEVVWLCLQHHRMVDRGKLKI